ncbi:MAG: V-type ATP synthase subunit D [Candidatus Omnitrophica bacterium]|nr:V-type ATP synthase subunit D [Candidatus Omnitrophota bacterium]
MPNVKLTKGELKRQRDALRQYQRYLPTLQLKKQQLQMEILHQNAILVKKEENLNEKQNAAKAWAGLLSDPAIDMRSWIAPREVVAGLKNIAGVDLPVFDHLEFTAEEYNLFIIPLWVDAAITVLRELVSLRRELDIIREGIAVLKRELRITTQRVNLFEKVKIPEAREIIRLIKIYIGDQMANAVGRSKIAKRKIEEAVLEEVAV